MSERLDTEFSVGASAHDTNVGTGTEVTMEFEIDTSENNLDSTHDPVDDIGFLDELDFDGDSIDTNLFDDDDIDMDFEESNL